LRHSELATLLEDLSEIWDCHIANSKAREGNDMRRPWTTLAGFLFVAASAIAADKYGDISGLKLAKPEDREDVKSVPPPKDAIVLFDGKSLDNWTTLDGKAPAPWKLVEGGAMEVHGGNILSKQMLAGDFKLHVEFRVPYLPDKKGQARGNSGVYVQGRYEVQVLDSYGIEKLEMGDCQGERIKLHLNY